MYCMRCGTRNEDSARFCIRCGARLRPWPTPERTKAWLLIMLVAVIAVIIVGTLALMEITEMDKRIALLTADRKPTAVESPDATQELAPVVPTMTLAPTQPEPVSPTRAPVLTATPARSVSPTPSSTPGPLATPTAILAPAPSPTFTPTITSTPTRTPAPACRPAKQGLIGFKRQKRCNIKTGDACGPVVIWIMNPDGSNQARMCNPSAYTWGLERDRTSPDGQQVPKPAGGWQGEKPSRRF